MTACVLLIMLTRHTGMHHERKVFLEGVVYLEIQSYTSYTVYIN